MKVIINMNEKVKVKLTAYGHKILRENFDALMKGNPFASMKFTEPKVDEQGYTEFQLWELFQEFGYKINIGFCNLFETDIVFEKPL